MHQLYAEAVIPADHQRYQTVQKCSTRTVNKPRRHSWSHERTREGLLGKQLRHCTARQPGVDASHAGDMQPQVHKHATYSVHTGNMQTGMPARTARQQTNIHVYHPPPNWTACWFCMNLSFAKQAGLGRKHRPIGTWHQSKPAPGASVHNQHKKMKLSNFSPPTHSNRHSHNRQALCGYSHPDQTETHTTCKPSRSMRAKRTPRPGGRFIVSNSKVTDHLNRVLYVPCFPSITDHTTRCHERGHRLLSH